MAGIKVPFTPVKSISWGPCRSLMKAPQEKRDPVPTVNKNKYTPRCRGNAGLYPTVTGLKLIVLTTEKKTNDGLDVKNTTLVSCVILTVEERSDIIPQDGRMQLMEHDELTGDRRCSSCNTVVSIAPHHFKVEHLSHYVGPREHIHLLVIHVSQERLARNRRKTRKCGEYRC